MIYQKRTLERFFQQASRQFPVMLLTGPRQTGKTTFLRHIAEEDRAYATLDDPTLRALAREDPALFLQRFQPPVLIDEIQYAPELLPFIKIAVDSEKRPGSFWLTGSQQFHLMKGVTESLAGRVGVVKLLGFSERELQGDPTADPFIPTPERIKQRTGVRPLLLNELYRKIWTGSFPALHQATPVDHDLFYSSYVQTYLQRDVRDLANVGDESAFLRFLRACAARTGQMLNIQDLCRSSDINHTTGKRWLSILENSGIVYTLESWHSNFNKRVIKTPKLYFLDTGLAAWLTAWSSPATLESGAMSGAFMETWVVSEVLKSWWHNGKHAPLYYYRDKDGNEVDLLVHQDGTLHPIEIKKSANPGKEAVRHFRALKAIKQPIGHGCLISLAPLNTPISPEIDAVPVGML
ncbi:ATP-binding protein [Chlorobium sp. N1]|uniref:ATP-binding protein n=1 Tax=Chlorobium sp. N1 TaxID=2491138 RepID=UPI00103BDCEA|nr:ATP-binding protein [Chlorobium sp. N1]TCD47128.1 ATP-binding protein [Chlorobium sp. N1]